MPGGNKNVEHSPTTAPELQAVIDSGRATWPEVEAVLLEIGMSRKLVAEWRASGRSVSDVLIGAAERGVEEQRCR